jgi:hypothetical protein
MRTTSTLAAALAVAALAAAPAAQARPADIHAPLARAQAKAQHKQDLRSADARDAAVHPRSAHNVAPLPGPPTWAVNPRPITPVPVAEVSDDGNGIDTTTIGLGIAGSLIAAGGAAALLTSRRSRRLQRPAV